MAADVAAKRAWKQIQRLPMYHTVMVNPPFSKSPRLKVVEY